MLQECYTCKVLIGALYLTRRLVKNCMLGQEVIKNALKNINDYPGVYKMLSEHGEVLYIGKAKNLKKRVSNYILNNLSTRISRMVFLTRFVETINTKTEAEALLLEANLIKKVQPRFNILLRDDKSYPYIRLTKHEYPQLTKFRGKNLEKGEFFGPFASTRDVDKTIAEIQKIFKIRPCTDNYFSNRKRPCLQYQIKRCTAPCVQKISREDYQDRVNQVKAFLCGKSQELQEILAKQMEECSEKMQYEKAADFRDRIKALSYVQLKSRELNIKDADLIAVYQFLGQVAIKVLIYRGGQNYGSKTYFPSAEGADLSEVLSSFIGQYYQSRPAPFEIITTHDFEDREVILAALEELNKHKVKITIPTKGDKKQTLDYAIEELKIEVEIKLSKISKNLKLMNSIKDLFGIEEDLERIEVYDNSHISGSFPVGVMVVATTEGFAKDEYRTFSLGKIEEVSKGDDYAMLREVMKRRLAKVVSKTGPIPSLMIIDGGIQHMNVVKQVMENLELNIPFVCMAKGKERNAGKENFFLPGKASFTIDKNEPVMKYLQILRDEAHNFAIKTHRNKRSKAIYASELDLIENIGEKRKKALLNYFGSMQAIKIASVEELQQVKTINKSLAKTIYQALHESIK